MNILKTHAISTAQVDTFIVYWTNSQAPKGVLKVVVTAKLDDKLIAAELAAIQHLIEVKRVLGVNVIGSAGMQLIVSSGAIRKLQRRQSDKAHLAPYANFLTTRFAGSQINVNKDSRWLDGCSPDAVEDLLVSGARRETLPITGLGDVAVTQHVLDRFIERNLPNVASDKAAQVAWKKLVEISSDPSVREVIRKSVWTGVKNNQGGKEEGRYFLNAKRNLVLVVTNNPREGKRLVTTYPVTKAFREMPKAA